MFGFNIGPLQSAMNHLASKGIVDSNTYQESLPDCWIGHCALDNQCVPLGNHCDENIDVTNINATNVLLICY